MQVDETTRKLIDERIEDIRRRRDFAPTTSPQGITASWLARVLREHGFTIALATLSNHIARRCRCGY
jgi:hypothetical protein